MPYFCVQYATHESVRSECGGVVVIGGGSVTPSGVVGALDVMAACVPRKESDRRESDKRTRNWQVLESVCACVGFMV